MRKALLKAVDIQHIPSMMNAADTSSISLDPGHHSIAKMVFQWRRSMEALPSEYRWSDAHLDRAINNMYNDPNPLLIRMSEGDQALLLAHISATKVREKFAAGQQAGASCKR